MNKSDNPISERFRALRESTGMNRKEFSEYLQIPYRTMQEWELGRRSMPEYVMELIDYKVRHEFQPTMTNELARKESVVEKIHDKQKSMQPKTKSQAINRNKEQR